MILSRGTVMTRGGVDALKEQLWAEAQRRGLGRAHEVLIVDDGAVWICNLAGDRSQYFAVAPPVPRPSAFVISPALASMKPASLATAMNCQPSAIRRCACAASTT